MKVYEYEGKTVEEATKKVLTELKIEEENLILKTTEAEGGLFKGKKVKVEALLTDEIIEYIRELLNQITSQMGINVNIESKKRDEVIKVNLFSDNNAILIGKGGKTIDAMQMIVRHSIHNKTGVYVNVVIDVEDYKEKQQKYIEILARNTAREVVSTGVEAKLDSMNSYERRLVHEALAEVKGITTVSEGEEPNRHVIIRPIEK